jgi:predicted metal-binding membrane protein
MERVGLLPSGSLLRRSRTHILILMLGAGAAWAWTAERSAGMGAMPGTMGMDAAAFIVMWTLMMTAMMLPSAAPFASMYARTIVRHRPLRLMAFAAGYLVVWGAAGIPAYGLAWLAGEAANASPTIGAVAAVVIFGACGIYQLTPIKYRCLSQCRSPIGQIFAVYAYHGPFRDVRSGLHNGWFCFGCCWSLMALMVAFGFMNLWAMVGLAAVVAVEKHWVRGALFGRVVAVVAFGLAIGVIFEPRLAPGLAGGNSMMTGMG